MKRLLVTLFGVMAIVVLAACGAATPGQTETSGGGGTPAKLRIGLLPIIDALPMYVAEAQGYFKEQKLDVELTVFASAMERDSALQAGQTDGQLNDLIATGLINKDGERAKAVRVSYKANPKMAMLTIVAAPNGKVKTAADLKGVPVAVSGNTVIEFGTDRMLRTAGLSPADIKTTEVTKIPVRLEMLAKGQIEAATLPEPFTSLALQQGARIVVDDKQANQNESVITFRQEVIEKNSDAMRRFLAAYEKGVQAISEKPEQYRDLMVEKAKVPDTLRQSLAIPPFPKAGVSSREEVASVVEWMVGKGMLPEKLSYERMINATLLPK